jgi:hypothetical protein
MNTSTDGIPASFTWTFDDFVASERSVPMLRNRLHDTWLLRAVGLLLGHLFLIIGPIFALMALTGTEGAAGPIPPEVVALNLGFSLIAAYLLYRRWYGWRRLTERAFQSTDLPGTKVSYRFLPTAVEVSSPQAEGRQSWSLYNEVVEFRDAFLLVSSPIAHWLPRRAFHSPAAVDAFIALAKSSAKHYRVIRRRTFLKPDVSAVD